MVMLREAVGRSSVYNLHRWLLVPAFSRGRQTVELFLVARMRAR
jgi:hypothetical protein